MLSYIQPPKELTDEELDAFKKNHAELVKRYERNRKRSEYYNTKRILEKVGFSIPPSMAQLDAVVGWPSKAVDQLSSRLKLEGFVDATRVAPPKKPPQPAKIDPETGIVEGPVIDEDPPEDFQSSSIGEDLDDIFVDNYMALEWPQVQTNTFIHGCAFVAVTPGDQEAGEPEVLIQGMPATEATGIWNVRTKRLQSALWVPNPRPDGLWPEKAVLFLPDHFVVIYREPAGVGPWKVERQDNPLASLKRVPVTRVAYRPQLGRPFGQSRVNRAVMYLTQMAARTLLRTEVSSEFYSSPQRWAMGAEADQFTDAEGNPISSWQTILGRIWTIGRDDEGNIPEVGQFPQLDMLPHVEMMKEITTLFAGETSLPVSALGIVHDNPASAEAIDAAWADMVSVAEICQTELGVALTEIAQNSLMTLHRGMNPKELRKIKPKWRDASTPTRAAMADATVKLVGAGVLPKESEVTLEMAGFNATDIARVMADMARARQNDPLANALGGLGPRMELEAGLQQQKAAQDQKAVESSAPPRDAGPSRTNRPGTPRR